MDEVVKLSPAEAMILNALNRIETRLQTVEAMVRPAFEESYHHNLGRADNPFANRTDK